MIDIRIDSRRAGIFAATGAFLIWGFSPIYYRAVGVAPALEIVAHRVVWSLVFTLVLVGLSGQLKQVLNIFRDARALGTLLLSSLLVSANWLAFIWAVNNERALEASMGYFVFPIVMVVLGGIFLKERLSVGQLVALLLVVLGVINLLFGNSQFPWIALLLAGSMGCYGLVRKTVAVEALPGLTMECLLLSPVALGYLIVLYANGELVFGSISPGFDLLLACSALMTALPLILFTAATRVLRLGTVGLLQYLNPTCQFLLAVLLFREPFTQAHWITFLLIWSGLVLFTLDSRKGRSAN